MNPHGEFLVPMNKSFSLTNMRIQYNNLKSEPEILLMEHIGDRFPKGTIALCLEHPIIIFSTDPDEIGLMLEDHEDFEDEFSWIEIDSSKKIILSN